MKDWRNLSGTMISLNQAKKLKKLLLLWLPSSRIDQLQYSLDPRHETVEPQNITGTGKISQMTMWLDASYKHYDTMDSFENMEGSIIVAINAWQTYYDVRINQLNLRAGTDVTIKVEPVVHSTSLGFKTLKLHERKCTRIYGIRSNLIMC